MQSDGESQALDVSVLMRVLNGGRPERRWQLARDLAELWCDAQADPAERVAVEPLLLQLAYDPVRKVRAELARALAPAQTLSDEIFFGIVADEPGIALVFLAESRALHPARMRVVMELGDDARRAVVLGRPDVSAEIIAPVLASAKTELVVPLLSNVSWHIEPEAAKALYRRLGHEADVAELLLAREELPAVVRALHVHLLRQRFAADLASRPFMAENRARLMLVESEEVALTAIAAEARAEEMNELAQFFVRHGLLTSALLVRLAARGSTAFLRHALAVIGCGKPEANITRLVGAAQLPEVVALVLRHALEVPADMQGDSFGVRVIERLALASDGVEARTRAMALQLLAEAGGEATQAVANALAGELGLVAA